MSSSDSASNGPDFQHPVLALAEKAALEPSGKVRDEFESGLLGQILARATLLAKSTIAYLVALVALYGVTWWLFGDDLSYLMKSARPWPQLLMIVFPLLIVGIPLGLELSERRRRKKLEALAVSTDQYKPGFFRLEPYEAADGASFTRTDRAHEKSLAWLLDSTLPSFRYLTGASGAGKTSLLQAFVLPALREKGWLTVNLRAREDGISRLEEILRREGTVWKNPPEASDIRDLLERALATLRRQDKRMLLVVDQFEELYILEAEADLGRVDPSRAAAEAVARKAFLALLQDLGARAIEGLVVLLSLRKDYEDMVIERYQLPRFRQDENRRTVELFDVTAAVAFLRASGTAASNEVLRAILEGAGRVEDREGLFRPVLLNLIGLQLVRSQGTLPCPPERIVSHYLLGSLSRQGLRNVAKTLLSPLVSDQGTAVARRLGELAEATGAGRLEVKGMLRSLRDDGLVRPLDGDEETWQIAHDFLARQIGLLVGRLQRSRWQAAVLWAAPFLLLGLLATIVFLPWWSRVQAHAELRRVAVVTGDDNNLAIQYTGANLDGLVTLAKILKVRKLTLREYIGSLDSLRGLTSLNSLDLSYGGVQELEPLRGLNSLTSLDLSHTSVQNLEPLRGLTSLSTLSLFATRVQNLEPLRGLTSLNSLNLFATRVQDLEPLRGLASLNSLDLTFANIQDLEPLRGLTSLTSLNLAGTKVQDLEPLRGLNSLSTLDLIGTNVKDLEPLRGLNSLTSLDLSSTDVQDLEPLRELTSLTSLDLARTGVQNLEPLRGLTSLTSLNLSSTNLESLEPIEGILSLKMLTLADTRLTSTDLARLRGARFEKTDVLGKPVSRP